MSKKNRLKAFSLLELSIVLLIVAAVTGSSMVLLIRYIEAKQVSVTEKKMKAIEDAVISYRIVHNNVPCPGSLTVSSNSGDFGWSGDGEEGTCSLGIALDGAGFNGIKGTVPTKTLGLPDDYAFDSWGNRILYVADKRFTGADAFDTYPITDTGTAGLHIKDGTGTAICDDAVVVLVSHGPNGHGAYNKDGLRVNAGSTEDDELNNCGCDNTGAADTEDRDFVQKTPSENLGDSTKVFDDIVMFMVRSQIRNPAVE